MKMPNLQNFFGSYGQLSSGFRGGTAIAYRMPRNSINLKLEV